MTELPMVAMNDLKRLHERYQARIEHAVTSTLRSGWWLNGAMGKRFANNFARFIGVSHCIPVANGTDALELALAATVKINGARGREVIMASNAGGYSSCASWHNGLIPHYVDRAINMMQATMSGTIRSSSIWSGGMAADRMSADALRFLVAGSLNTALTCLIYFVSLTILPSSLSYAIAWITGLLVVMVFYPDRVFPGGRNGFVDRLAVGGTIAVVFLVGLASLHMLESVLQNTTMAFFITLATTTVLNFLISRWILRRSC